MVAKADKTNTPLFIYKSNFTQPKLQNRPEKYP